jgi:hypothetical protein
MWESFSVHHDLITHRSEFFRASRSPQWKKPGEPTPLVDEDPSVFALYLHCLCFGTKDLERRIETEAKEEWAAEGDDKATLDEIVIGKHLSAMRFFINLYILSDRLLDPITANLVIDRLINFTETSRSGPSVLLIIHLYASTTADSPLRKLARDWCIHHSETSWVLNWTEEVWAELPPDFSRDLISETFRLRKAHPDKRVDEAFKDTPASRKKGFYHQKVEEQKSEGA